MLPLRVSVFRIFDPTLCLIVVQIIESPLRQISIVEKVLYNLAPTVGLGD